MTDRLTRLLVTQRDIKAEDPLRSGEELELRSRTEPPSRSGQSPINMNMGVKHQQQRDKLCLHF